MNIDATFWVAVSFFIFFGVLVYLKVPQKINNSLTNEINEIKKELEEAEKLKKEARDLLGVYESKIAKSQNMIYQLSVSADMEKNIVFLSVLADKKVELIGTLSVSADMKKSLSVVPCPKDPRTSSNRLLNNKIASNWPQKQPQSYVGGHFQNLHEKI